MKSLTLFLSVIAMATAAPADSTIDPDINPNVIGGDDAYRGEFPYLLSLQTVVSGRRLHICGAAIYNTRWAISAAHCIFRLIISEDHMKIVAGEHNLDSIEGSEQIIGVTEAVIHDQYNPFTMANDIVLLKLKDELQYDQYVQPINIPIWGYSPQGSCVFSGWGATHEHGSSISTPKKVWLPIIYDAKCNTYYYETGVQLKSSMICAGYEYGGGDACSKDDGGPLVCSSGGHNYLTGLSSFGIGCGRPFFPGIYTEVSYFADWIAQKTLL